MTMKTNQEASSVENDTTMAFRLSGRHVDAEVLKGRDLNDVLAELQSGPGGDFWFNREALRGFSAAVAAMYAQGEPVVENDTAMAFRLSGRHVDAEVLKGRALNDVLADFQRLPGGSFWFDPEALRGSSAAVAATH